MRIYYDKCSLTKRSASFLSVNENNLILAKPDCIHCLKDPLYSNNSNHDSLKSKSGYPIERYTPQKPNFSTNEQEYHTFRRKPESNQKLLNRSKSNSIGLSDKIGNSKSYVNRKTAIDVNNSFAVFNTKTPMVKISGNSIRNKKKSRSNLNKANEKQINLFNTMRQIENHYYAAFEFRFKVFVSNNFDQLIRPFLSCTNYINIKFSHILDKKKRISDRRLMAIERHTGCRFVLPKGPILSHHKGKDCIFAAILGPSKESLKKAMSSLHSDMPEISSSFQFKEEDIIDISSELNEIFGITSLKKESSHSTRNVQVSTIENFLQENNLNDIIAESKEYSNEHLQPISIDSNVNDGIRTRISNTDSSHDSKETSNEHLIQTKNLFTDVLKKGVDHNIKDTDSALMLDKQNCLEKKLKTFNNSYLTSKKNVDYMENETEIKSLEPDDQAISGREKTSFYAGVKAVLDKLARTKSIRNHMVYNSEKYEVFNIDNEGQIREGNYDPYNKIITLIIRKQSEDISSKVVTGYLECKLVNESIRLFRHNFEGEILSKRLSLLGGKCGVSFVKSEVFIVKDAKLIRVKMTSEEHSSLLLATQFVFHLVT